MKRQTLTMFAMLIGLQASRRHTVEGDVPIAFAARR
jgi:hypothetical protein